MNCNACMSRSLASHVCREKCFEDYCPICHEYFFTSSNPIKGLPCGHLMQSACFLEYTCSHYTCPTCCKLPRDMQASGLKKGSIPLHWLCHKCPYCGSYNTRLL